MTLNMSAANANQTCHHVILRGVKTAEVLLLNGQREHGDGSPPTPEAV